MDDTASPKLTNEDLYGPTRQDDTIQSVNEVNTPVPQNSPFEEKGLPDPLATPELPSEGEQNLLMGAKKGSFFGTVFLLGVLFFIGVALSIPLRMFLTPSPEPTKQPAFTNQIPSPEAKPDTGTASWNAYLAPGSIITAAYRLPPEVLEPICDSQTCVSEGTYLPGGTRFTISVKSHATPVTDFSRSVITDANGKAFTTTPATIGDKNALSFTGTNGTTSGGYAFTQIKGVLINISPLGSLELNHFTPSGITTDFGSDDILFDKIVSSLDFTAPPASPTADVIP